MKAGFVVVSRHFFLFEFEALVCLAGWCFFLVGLVRWWSVVLLIVVVRTGSVVYLDWVVDS